MFPDPEEMQDPIESQEVYIKAEKNTSNDQSTCVICSNSFNSVCAVQIHLDHVVEMWTWSACGVCVRSFTP